MSLKTMSLFFHIIILCFCFPLCSMEYPQEATIDLLLMNKRQNHPVELKLSRKFSLKLLPPINFTDHDNTKMLINRIYEPSEDGIDTIVLPPSEACLLNNINEHDFITWVGGVWNSQVNIKGAIKDSLPAIRFFGNHIYKTNVLYHEILCHIENALSQKEPSISLHNLMCGRSITEAKIALEKRAKQNAEKPKSPEKMVFQKDKWELRDINRFEEFDFNQNPFGGVKAFYVYRPERELDENAKPLLLVVIHGTWSQESHAFFDPYDKGFQEILKFAQEVAEYMEAPIEVLSLKWHGSNESLDRVAAGENLATILMKFYAHKNYTIITLAHSHGCNVVNAASRKLENLLINLIIQIATPVRDENESNFNPKNFERLIQFYSTSDLVGMLGSLSSSTFFSKKGSMRKYAKQTGKHIYNIRTQIDGIDCTHQGIRPIIQQLSPILSKIHSHYTYNTDLELNINTQHSNVDTVILCIRNDLPLRDFFKLSALQDLTEENAHHVSMFINIFKQELAYSNEQEQAFKVVYLRDIHEKASIPQRALAGGFAESLEYFGYSGRENN